MQVWRLITLSTVLGLASGHALAASANASDPGMLALAKKSNCYACHSVDHKVYNPAPKWEDVAKKYRNDPQAQTKLVEKVKKGGEGHWGNTPMPAKPAYVKDEDVEKLVKWILSL